MIIENFILIEGVPDEEIFHVREKMMKEYEAFALLDDDNPIRRRLKEWGLL
jgi:hypothetical protein